MSGINRILSGEVSQSKTKGSALVAKLKSVFSPSNIATTVPKTQECHSKKK